MRKRIKMIMEKIFAKGQSDLKIRLHCYVPSSSQVRERNVVKDEFLRGLFIFKMC